MELTNEKADLRVSVIDKKQVLAVMSDNRVKHIYLDEASFDDKEFSSLIKKIHKSGKKAGIRLRRMERSDLKKHESSEELLRKLIDYDELECPDSVLIRCLDDVYIAERFPELEKVFDYTVYAYNSEAMSIYKDLGADRMTFPVELKYQELLNIENGEDRSLPYELSVYGHLPMMVSANCIEKTYSGCSHNSNILFMKDRKNKKIPVKMFCKYCYNEIYNPEPMVLYDMDEIIRLKPDSIRYDFTIESPEEIIDILDGKVPNEFTRAHFKRGIL